MGNLRGQLIENAEMTEYSSWQVGGIADRLYKPADMNDLIQFIQQLPKQEPLIFLGLGSNTLIRDGGIRGTVVITQGALNKLKSIDAVTLYAEAGVASPAFARFSARKNLIGAEFLAGIPGTIGGALVMNAGCDGSETWNILKSVLVINRQGEKKIRYPSEYKVAYRSVSVFPDEFYLAAEFQLKPGSKEKSLSKIRDLLKYRADTQPTNEPNCGSVFRNPPGDYAARLIEACGLKGLTIGNATISNKHANFIINNGHASATDIEALIEKIADCVFHKFHIRLIPEVRIIGQA
ncbi:MAG: UDP-N-acetylenolpyruvoylglucosamine reductase [Pseudomonadota bacterium]|jgi:UDP-N-acetylmuramate dehydrogenase